MSNHDLQASARIWTEYWRSGRQGCLTDEAPVSARNHIESLWRSWFRKRPSGTQILDLACGAGEVARIALSVASEGKLRFGIEGVDLAALERSVERTAFEHGTTMRLQGGIDLARLPFPDRSFDCAASQFGIEYADVEAACRELARVMKSEACGLFLIHHRESAISTAAASRLDAFAAVIGDGVVLDRARQLYEAISARSAESLSVSRLLEFRQDLRRIVKLHSSRFAWETNLREILGFLTDLARNPKLYDPLDALRRLSAAQERIAMWKLRQESQLAAARDERGIGALSDCLGRFGLKSGEIGVVNDPATGESLAWRLAFAAPQLSGQ